MGYPNEHLAGDSDAEIASPLYATAVGLLMNAVKNQSKMQAEAISAPETDIVTDEEERVEELHVNEERRKERKSVFDKWSEKLKEFLDNAE
ncbi:MAG: cell division protein FtsA [Maribacter sp.]